MEAPRGHQAGLLALAVFATACRAEVAFSSAQAKPPAAHAAIESTADPLPIRDVRVLLARSQHQVRLRCPGGCRITSEVGDTLAYSAAREWALIGPGAGGQVVIFLTAGRFESAEPIVFEPSDGETIEIATKSREEERWSSPVEFPGTARLLADGGGGIHAVNLVDVERYVASVVAHEAWPTFHAEALLAQAIVARTFVLDQMMRRDGDEWDVVATQAAQVYRGRRDDGIGQSARLATRSTRGLVCAWRDDDGLHIFPTYYSAVCGGVSQPGSIFGSESDIPPLAGGVRCDYCKIAPKGTYRWGPVRMGESELRERLLQRYPDYEALGTIEELVVTEQTSDGRPVRVQFIGEGGERRELTAEQFRQAVGPTTMLSTACDIRLADGELVVENGRGFGHGLGLCQWGMEGQARANKRASEILKFYYPGVEIVRVY